MPRLPVLSGRPKHPKLPSPTWTILVNQDINAEYYTEYFPPAAPEVQHKGSCATYSDLYSLGMVFIACFNGGQGVIQASHSSSNFFKLAGQVRPADCWRADQSFVISVVWTCQHRPLSDSHRTAGGRLPPGEPRHQAQTPGQNPRTNQLLRVRFYHFTSELSVLNLILGYIFSEDWGYWKDVFEVYFWNKGKIFPI